MVVGFSTALSVQGLLVRIVVPRLGESRSLHRGNWCCPSWATRVGIGLADRGWLLSCSSSPLALGGLAGPAIQAIISREVGPAKEQGEVQGLLNSLSMIAAAIVALVIVRTSLPFKRFGPEDSLPAYPRCRVLRELRVQRARSVRDRRSRRLVRLPPRRSSHSGPAAARLRAPGLQVIAVRGATMRSSWAMAWPPSRAASVSCTAGDPLAADRTRWRRPHRTWR